MNVNPTDLAVLRYNTAKSFRAGIGPTYGLRPGALAKASSNLLVPAADNDENIRLFAVLEGADAAATGLPLLVVPFSDAVVEMGYTGGTPTMFTDYGITDQNTVDIANTTQLMVTVVGINTARTTVDVIEYQISA